MNRNVIITLISSAFIFNLHHAIETTPEIINYLKVRSQLDHESDETILKYLPKRLKDLEQQVNTNGISQATENIINDPDLDSSLFIFDADKPYRLVAYSRQPTWGGKTPEELQKIVWSSDNTISLTQMVNDIIILTKEITTYSTNEWFSVDNDKPVFHICYTMLITSDNKPYILGVTMATQKNAIQIILPHRINQVLARIKLEGFENVASTINKNLISEYFFIAQLQYPYRFIAHREPWAGLTPAQAGKITNPHCTQPECDVAAVSKTTIPIAQQGGGFHAYLWQSDQKDAPILKIAYVKPFEHNKKKLYIGTGLPADVPAQQAKELKQFVENYIKLIQEIGLENAVSSIRNINTPERYIYIVQTDPPYFFPVHASPAFDQHTEPEIQKYIDLHGKSVNIKDIIEKNIAFIKRGGGFYAYKFLADIQNPQKGISLKVAYTLPFTYNGKNYYIATGIPVEQVLLKQKTRQQKSTTAALLTPEKKIITIENKLVFDYLNQCCTYDLQSDDAITKYLPARLKNFHMQIKNVGIEQAAQELNTDPDLNSYLFIFENTAPYRLVAYSRHPEWYNKTPEELQKLLPNNLKNTIDLKKNILSILKSAIIIDSYMQYQWLPDLIGNYEQTAFFTTIKNRDLSRSDKSYIIGSALYTNKSFGHIIIPYNVNTIIKQIKDIGLTTTIKLINEDPTINRYFYITHAQYPYRYIVYGNKPELVNQTPIERQFLADPSKTKAYFNYPNRVHKLINIAQKGGGFYAYLWPLPENTKLFTIRIAYAKMFAIKKEKYMLVNGYSLNIPPQKVAKMQQDLENAYKLTQIAGLENTISALQESNTINAQKGDPDDYIFIVDTELPITYLLHPSPYYNQHSISEVQTYLNTFTKFHITPFAPKATALARKGGGLLVDTFFLDIEDPDRGIGLKVSFIKPFIIKELLKDHLYYLSTGHLSYLSPGYDAYKPA